MGPGDKLSSKRQKEDNCVVGAWSGPEELSDAIVGWDQECHLLEGGARVEEAGGRILVGEGKLGGGRLCWASWQVNLLSSTPLYHTEGFRCWEVERSGNGWAVEKNLTVWCGGLLPRPVS